MSNELYQQWQDAAPESKEECLAKLVAALRVYAKKIIWIRLQKSVPELEAKAIWQAIHSPFREDSKFTTWYHVILRNLCMDYLRDKLRHSVEVPLEEESLTGELENETIARMDFQKAAKQLGVEENKLLKLLVDGYTEEEIAELEGVSHQQINRRKADLRAKMGGILNGNTR